MDEWQQTYCAIKDRGAIKYLNCVSACLISVSRPRAWLSYCEHSCLRSSKAWEAAVASFLKDSSSSSLASITLILRVREIGQEEKEEGKRGGRESVCGKMPDIMHSDS